ncbi:extracellular calcium-sensing receptor-like [Latimeria chalumnae]|uniref:extracellular calcium-sensing receptor-like n=1 Tax=Latimeria chalumnae TaxID=7897 RepID=UPI0006D901CD|nr:PREDICTED: extracellular calcium-sensing receptor-like [Latimeria chalumnae]|eukprot:XP_014354372.1 PREDICTED: extracellular calcium-sensing receptor-like [Latimeria chalumnae]
MHLLKYFGWTWVGILAADSDDGEIGSQILKEELSKASICVAFSETIPIVHSVKETVQAVEVIKRSSANAIVAIAFDAFVVPLTEEVIRQNITGKVWIATEAWSTSANLFNSELAGTIGLAVRNRYIPGYKEFLLSLHPFTSENNIYIENFWEEIFGCKWPDTDSNQTISDYELDDGIKICTGRENMDGLNNYFLDMSNLGIVYNVYTAVYAVAHALQDLSSCKPGEGPFFNGSCADIHDFEPWQLLHYFKDVHFVTKVGDKVYFDNNGNPPAEYEILNWHLTTNTSLKYVKVGSIDFSAPQGKKFISNESAIMWHRGQTQIPRSVCSESCPPGYRKAARQRQPICCFDCIPCSKGEISNQTDSSNCLKCPDDHWSNDKRNKCIPKTIEFLSYEEPLGATLAAISTFSSLLPAAILFIFIKYQETPIVKANNRGLSYLLLLALMLCFLCSLIFIGYPTRITCMLRQSAFGIVFALCVSCVLAKTIMVVIAFNAMKPNSKLKKLVGPKLSNSIVLVCTVIQVIICIAWLSSVPPFPVQNMKSQIGVIIIECNEGSAIAFWCMLGYMGLLAIVSFIVAVLARNLPDSFNEAKFITFSMLVFVSVWLAFIPAYLSARGKYMVAVEIFAILASSTGLMACLFFPKCYVILLHPDMNTREHLMGKGTFSTTKATIGTSG